MYRTSYVATPFLEDRRSWLAQLGARLPPPGAVARHPSDAELRLALAQLTGYRAHYTPASDDGRYQILIESLADPEQGPWTKIHVRPHTSESDRVEFWFDQGWAVTVLSVAARVAVYCGPLVIAPDSGAHPLIVVAGMDAEQAAADWASA